MAVFGAIFLGSYQAQQERAAISGGATYEQEGASNDPALRADVPNEGGGQGNTQGSDLQAQWQMAKAAWAGIWISYGALVGLVIAAHFARLAWLALV